MKRQVIFTALSLLTACERKYQQPEQQSGTMEPVTSAALGDGDYFACSADVQVSCSCTNENEGATSVEQ